MHCKRKGYNTPFKTLPDICLRHLFQNCELPISQEGVKLCHNRENALIAGSFRVKNANKSKQDKTPDEHGRNAIKQRNRRCRKAYVVQTTSLYLQKSWGNTMPTRQNIPDIQELSYP
ncbi:MAG: hypothetical protein CVU06_08815 [Bacteroidetes bacterium HGW-Bacteroidetes-22]|nr:MAG: hypothetical protein CVU06_08815 [Bacteroidetes bacterium HGW-Bacteroidetes-22]